MRLKRIVTADFRKSEQTNFVEMMAGDEAIVLGVNDVVCFVSRLRDQLCFVSRFEEVSGSKGIVRVLASRRLRVTGGSWEPMMLVNYAAQVGLELEGLRSFEQYHRKLVPTGHVKKPEEQS